MIVPDIYYPVVKSVNDNAELRFSLRSLKNIEHGDVYIVGYKPLWLTGVKHIPFDDIPRNDVSGVFQGYKNQRQKLNLFLKESRTEEVILMNDDIYILKKMNVGYYKREENLQELLEKFKKTKPSYIVRLIENKLKNYPNGFSDFLHFPLRRNREKFLSISQENCFSEIGGGKDYINEFYQDHDWENRKDFKIYNVKSLQKLNTEKTDIFSTSDKVGASIEFEKIMKQVFPEKSCFEL